MSGIDKVMWSTGNSNSRNAMPEINIFNLLRRIREHGLHVERVYLSNERKNVAHIEEYPGTYLVFSYPYDQMYSNNVRYNQLKKLIINPSRLGGINDFMTIINIVGEGWLNRRPISRIDYAVDYNVRMSDFIHNIDVTNVQRGELYQDTVSGNTLTLYRGSGDDRLMIYDKAAELRRRRKTPEHDDWVRIERQLRGATTVASGIGISSGVIDLEYDGKLFLNDLCRHFSASCHAEIMDICDIFERVQLHYIHYANENDLSANQIQKLYKFIAWSEVGGYGLARRKAGSNFNRDFKDIISTSSYMNCNQPRYILQQAMRRFMGAEVLPRQDGEIGIY